jgi:predicted N-formylglutamate amidohydrolase
MKRCPTCNRTFDDDTLMVCPDDGSALPGAREMPATQGYAAFGGKATWNPSPDQIAEIQQYVAANTKPRRKTWPWVVVGIVVLFILIALVGAIVVARL